MSNADRPTTDHPTPNIQELINNGTLARMPNDPRRLGVDAEKELAALKFEVSRLTGLLEQGAGLEGAIELVHSFAKSGVVREISMHGDFIEFKIGSKWSSYTDPAEAAALISPAAAGPAVAEPTMDAIVPQCSRALFADGKTYQCLRPKNHVEDHKFSEAPTEAKQQAGNVTESMSPSAKSYNDALPAAASAGRDAALRKWIVAAINALWPRAGQASLARELDAYIGQLPLPALAPPACERCKELESQLADIARAFGNATALDGCKTLADKASAAMRQARKAESAEAEAARLKSELSTEREVLKATEKSLFNLMRYATGSEEMFNLPMSGHAVTVRDEIKKRRAEADELRKRCDLERLRSDSDKCPKCGAEQSHLNVLQEPVYACGRVGERDTLQCLRNQLAAERAARVAAEEIVAKLPKTADGVPVVFGDAVFPPCGGPAIESRFRGGKAIYCFHGNCRDEGCQGDGSSSTYHDVSTCYSTKQAARAAGQERKP